MVQIGVTFFKSWFFKILVKPFERCNNLDQISKNDSGGVHFCHQAVFSFTKNESVHQVLK